MTRLPAALDSQELAAGTAGTALAPVAVEDVFNAHGSLLVGFAVTIPLPCYATGSHARSINSANIDGSSCLRYE